MSWWELICDQCGNRFTPPQMGRRHVKYCSNACRQKAYRQRKAEERMREDLEWARGKAKEYENKMNARNAADRPGT